MEDKTGTKQDRETLETWAGNEGRKRTQRQSERKGERERKGDIKSKREIIREWER